MYNTFTNQEVGEYLNKVPDPATRHILRYILSRYFVEFGDSLQGDIKMLGTKYIYIGHPDDLNTIRIRNNNGVLTFDKRIAQTGVDAADWEKMSEIV